jgi:hypothetical protein
MAGASPAGDEGFQLTEQVNEGRDVEVIVGGVVRNGTLVFSLESVVEVTELDRVARTPTPCAHVIGSRA